MSRSLCPQLRQFYIFNQLPANGGKIHTYEAGTTTPIVTYKTKGGTPHTNPIICDSDGGVQIWLDDGVGYKFVITSHDDQPIDTIDNVSTATAGLSTDENVKVTSADSTAGHLQEKVQSNTIGFAVLDPGSNEKLRMDVAKLPMSATDTGYGFLNEKVVAGTNVTIAEVEGSAGKALEISADTSSLQHNDLSGRSDFFTHPLLAIDCTQGTLGTPEGYCPQAYVAGVSLSSSTHLQDLQGALHIGTQNSSFLFTPDGGIAIPFVAQEALTAGDIVSVSQIDGTKVVLTPAYGTGAIGVAFQNAVSGQTVWAVVGGKVKINIAPGNTVAPGDTLSTSSTVGKARNMPPLTSDVPASYNILYTYATAAKVATALSTVDVNGRVMAVWK